VRHSVKSYIRPFCSIFIDASSADQTGKAFFLVPKQCPIRFKLCDTNLIHEFINEKSCVGRSITGSRNCKQWRDEHVEQESQWLTSQSRKESILNSLLIGNRGFMCKREIKRWIKKLSDYLEEGKLKQHEKLNRNKNPIWNDVHYTERQTNGSLFEKTLNYKAKNITNTMIVSLSLRQ